MENRITDFEEIDGRKFPIIWRKKGKEETDPCPYCGKKHIHGTAEGHRIAHCVGKRLERKIIPTDQMGVYLSDGTYVEQNAGYVLREYSNT